MMNPLDEQRPLAQLFIILLLAGAAYWIDVRLGIVAAVIFTLLSLFCLPASVAILGLEGNLIKAINPIAWAAMIKGLGVLYPVVLGLIALCALIVFALSRLDLWLSVSTAIAMFGVLSVFSLLGGAIYERRDQLGIHAWVSPERDAEKQRKQDHAESERLVHQAYGLQRVDRHIDAWELLQRWLTEHGHAVDAYAWICQSVSSWDDPRYLTRLSQDHIERLLILKRTGEALTVAATRLNADPTFRPKTAAATLQIAQLAARGGGLSKVARTLTNDFAARFPDDPRTPTAVALARHLQS